MKVLPRARIADLIVKELENELLIYDMLTNDAICLNKMSMLIWRYCDGKTKSKDLIEKYNLTEDLINLALDDFQNHKLLKDKIETGVPKKMGERRRFLVRAGAVAAVAIPIVRTIVAPQAISAQSACISGTHNYTAPSPSCATACQSAFNPSDCCNSVLGFSHPPATCSCTVVCN